MKKQIEGDWLIFYWFIGGAMNSECSNILLIEKIVYKLVLFSLFVDYSLEYYLDFSWNLEAIMDIIL